MSFWRPATVVSRRSIRPTPVSIVDWNYEIKLASNMYVAVSLWIESNLPTNYM
jgi:hypothetical protein